ncbi:MAG: histidine kinase [Clostridia bacterium]|nr:histidine kinase [Clostridia bacterium]
MIKNKRYLLSNSLIFLFFLSLGVFLSISYIDSQSYYTSKNPAHCIKYSGTYSVNNSPSVKNIPKNHKISLHPHRKTTTVRLIIRLQENISEQQPVNLYSEYAKIRVLKNGTEIASYGYRDRFNDVVFTVKDWFSFSNVNITTKDVLTIEIKSDIIGINESYLHEFLNNIVVGTKEQLMKYNIEKNLTSIIIAGFIFVMGFVLCILMLTFKLMNSPVNIGDFSCSFLMMSGALIIFFNYDYITLLFRNTLMVNIIDTLNHLLVLFFMLIYFRLYVHGEMVKRAVIYFQNIWALMIVLFCVLYVFKGFNPEVIFSSLLIPAIVIILVTALFLCIDYSHIESSHSKIMIGSGLIMCVSSLSEFTCRYLKGYFLHYSFFVGLVVFSIIQFIAIMIIAKRNILQASRAEYIENELLQSKISVMLSQIQPHFLYNTLVVIRHLCEKNPKLAKEAITEFASYLRGNLDSLTLNTTISFEKEMEHVENYISLEKKRFGDKIEIDYDIEATDFEVPSLTIQTIVENAIRHGITKRKEGGTVSIITKEYAYTYTIEVKDNGVGISEKIPEKKDNRSHIGIENARKRIETMCHGTLDFQSTPNVGTTVRITLPK